MSGAKPSLLKHCHGYSKRHAGFESGRLETKLHAYVPPTRPEVDIVEVLGDFVTSKGSVGSKAGGNLRQPHILGTIQRYSKLHRVGELGNKSSIVFLEMDPSWPVSRWSVFRSV